MSAIDYLPATPHDRYEAAFVAKDTAAGEHRLGRRARGALGFLTLCAVALGLMALRIWIYMPASFRLHG
jgi:hypothetical protein